MLPQELSSDICSLRPGEDRLVLSCIMMIDQEGEIRSYEVTSGVIRSVSRMTYTQVHAILSGDEAARTEFAPLVPEFERMLTLAKILNRKREQRGSIDFDLPEPIIDFNDEGEMQGILRSDRTWANRLIEEFMLSANECVADWHQRLGVPSIYRIHEKPDARRVIDFEETAAHFGYSLGLGALPVQRVQFKSERREFREAEDDFAAQHQRIGHELEARADLEPQQVHVDAAQALGVDRAGQVRVDPRIEIEVGLLERGELVAGRRPAYQVERQRVEVTIVGERALRDAIAERRERDGEHRCYDESAHYRG